MSHVRCIFSASKDMTINIKLFPIYSNSYGHAYDAMFAHDIAATFPSDRVRVCVANFVDRARCLHAHVRHEYIYRALILQYIYIYICIYSPAACDQATSPGRRMDIGHISPLDAKLSPIIAIIDPISLLYTTKNLKKNTHTHIYL